jgi:basic membrane protein A
MFKKLHIALGIVISVSLLLAACGTAATPTTAPSTGGTAALFVGEVTDTGGIDDKSFNALGWQGVQDAISQLGIEGKYLQSNQQSDYAKNIQEFLNENAGLIITVGYLLGVDTATAAKANPDTKFAIVDYTYPDCFGTQV